MIFLQLAHWLNLLGEPLSQNLVFKLFRPEPPPLPPYTTIISRPKLQDLSILEYLYYTWFLEHNN